MVRERLLARALWCCAVLAVPVGCVPYQKYDQLRKEIDRANRVNEDLVNRLNQEMVKGKQGFVVESGIAPATHEKLLEENARLARLLEEARQTRPQRGFTEEDRARLGPQVVLEQGGLALGSDLLFPSGVANLRKGHLPVLDNVAELLKTKYAGEKIIIEGHTDDVPLKSVEKLYEDNLNLGYHRARAVYKYFKDEHGIPEDQMVLVSYGFMSPLVPNHSNEARAKNRRVVLRRGGEIRGFISRN